MRGEVDQYREPRGATPRRHARRDQANGVEGDLDDQREQQSGQVTREEHAMTLTTAATPAVPRPFAKVAPANRGVVLAAGFAVTAVLALTVALRAPLATVVLGLIAFGVLHNVLEIRYVAGRFAGVLRGSLLWTLLGLISGIVLCRLVG